MTTPLGTILSNHVLDGVTLEDNAGVIQIKDGGVTSLKFADTIAIYTGAWLNTTNYAIGNMVSHKGGLYLSIAVATNQEPPNSSYWITLVAPDLSYKYVIDRGTQAVNATNFSSATHWYLNVHNAAPIPYNGGNPAIGCFYLDPADYPPPDSERSLKLRLIFELRTNGTSMGGTETLTAGLYPVASLSAGGSTGPGLTDPSANRIAASTVVIPQSPPTITHLYREKSADFPFPAAGHYVLGIQNTSVPAASSAGPARVILESRWT